MNWTELYGVVRTLRGNAALGRPHRVETIQFDRRNSQFSILARNETGLASFSPLREDREGIALKFRNTSTIDPLYLRKRKFGGRPTEPKSEKGRKRTANLIAGLWVNWNFSSESSSRQTAKNTGT